jgi:hypothetical protein
MKPRIFVHDLSEEEQRSLFAGLRSSDAFILRRSQILLASARGETAPRIAQALSRRTNKPFAMPSTPSTRAGFQPSKLDRVARTTCQRWYEQT